MTPDLSRRRMLTLAGLTAGTTVIGLQAAYAQDGPPRGTHTPAPLLGPAEACTVPPNHDPNVIRTVYQVGLNLGVNDRVMLAGFEAGWVESHMNNLPCGDLDSVGVFQQRPSQGWGTVEQCMNVAYASNSFFTRAITVNRNNPGWSAGQVAQAVQRSAFPERYDQAEAKARAMMAEAAGSVAPVITTPPGQYAYEWGNQQHAFARGANGALLHWYWDPGSQVNLVEWGRQGMQGQPNGFAYHDQQHIFARSPHDTLNHWWWTPQGGVAYADWGGECLSNPVSYWWRPYNQQHIFAKGLNNSLYHWFWDPGDMQVHRVEWGRQGFQGNPAGFTWHDQQHVFARSPHNTLNHWWWTPQGGVAYADWGGQCLSDPIAYVWPPYSQQHIFAKAANGEMFHWYWDPGTMRVDTVSWGGQIA